jgi:osmotically inducible protein OsmC
MSTRRATAIWRGSLEEGKGRIQFGHGRFDEPYSAGSRFGDESDTNPEELVAAAHAACFSMAFALGLVKAGHKPEHIETEAAVSIEQQGDGYAITTSKLTTKANVPGMDDDVFQQQAEDAKKNCPVSKALAGCDIQLDATLE